MSIASGAKVGISYVAEAVHGTTPAVPVMKALRVTTRNLNAQKNTVESQEVREDRQTTSFRHGFNQVQGSLGFELSHGVFDDILEGALAGAWAAAGVTPIFTGATQRLKLGAADIQTFTFERRFTDILRYQAVRGCAINRMQLNIPPEGIVGGSFDIVGMSFSDLTSVTLGVPTPALAHDPFSSFEGELLFDGAVIGVVTGIQTTVNNNRSVLPVVGSKFSPDVFEGGAVVEGTITAFLEDDSPVYSAFFNEEEVAIRLRLDDINGTDFMGLAFHRVKINAGDMDPPQNGPVEINAPFRALYDATQGTTLTIERTGT